MRTKPATVLLLVLMCAACSAAPRERDEPRATTSSPTPSAGEPTSGPAPVRSAPFAWVDDLPTGRPPRIGYALGHTFHRPDGSTMRLPRRFGITSITLLGDGYLATDDRHFEGSVGVFRLTGDGTIDRSRRAPGHQQGFASTSGEPVLDAGGSTLYWVTFTPPESGLSLPTMLYAADVRTGAERAWELDLPPASLTSVVGVVGDEVLVRRGWVGDGSTWAVVPGLSTRRWRGAVPEPTSPRATYALAHRRSGTEVVRARSGRVVATLPHSAGRGRVSTESLAWEGEHHLLASVVRRQEAAVLRYDVRARTWAVAVPWTDHRGVPHVAFETVR